jgi:D-sedoheptulose 7-phosphate isomerase
VIAAFEAAKSRSIFTIGLLGRDGGKLRDRSDLAIVVESRSTARIQEAHILIGHTLCGAVETELGY